MPHESVRGHDYCGMCVSHNYLFEGEFWNVLSGFCWKEVLNLQSHQIVNMLKCLIGMPCLNTTTAGKVAHLSLQIIKHNILENK